MTVEGHTVGTLIARCAGAVGRPAVRLRLEHLLGHAELAPRALPPRTVLVVRRATAPKPLALGRTRLGGEWEAEVRGRLAEQLRRAERPDRGRVSPRAGAVVFADEAEWLACFSLAAAAGDLGAAWLWRGLAEAPNVSAGGRRALSAGDLAAVWRRSPLALPAAAARLCEWGRAGEVFGRLTTADCEAVSAALGAGWGLPAGVWRDSGRGTFDGTHGAAGPRAEGGATHDPGRHGDAGRPHGAAPAAPTGGVGAGAQRGFGVGGRGPEEAGRGLDGAGTARGGEAGADGFASSSTGEPPPALLRGALAGGRLSPEAARLLAVAVALFERPTRVRSEGFAADLRQWLADTGGAWRHAPPAPAPPKPVGRAGSPRVEVRDQREEEEREGGESPGAGSAEGAAGPEPRAGSSSGSEARAGRATDGRAGKDAARAGAAEGDESLAVETHGGREGEGEEVEAGAGESAAVSPWLGAAEFETRLGGAFYLLNLFRMAGLPECFDEELGLSEHLSGWGLTELFARWLLAAEGDGPRDGAAGRTSWDEVAGDGLWELCARLEGRAAGVAPAAGLRCGEAFSLPAGWAALLGADGPKASSQDESSQAKSPRDGSPQDELPPAEDIERVWPEASEDLRRWMRRIFPVLRQLLARLLGDEGLGRAELARAVVRRRGVVYVTGMHVDVVMGLDQISLDVRRAGLDASPGWSRDLARVVTFHFE